MPTKEVGSRHRRIALRSGAGRRTAKPRQRLTKAQREARDSKRDLAHVCRNELSISPSRVAEHALLWGCLEEVCEANNFTFWVETVTWEDDFENGDAGWMDMETGDFTVPYYPPKSRVLFTHLEDRQMGRGPRLVTRFYRSRFKAMKTGLDMLKSHIRWEKQLARLRRQYGYPEPIR